MFLQIHTMISNDDFSKAWHIKVELPVPLINSVDRKDRQRRHGKKGLQLIIN